MKKSDGMAWEFLRRHLSIQHALSDYDKIIPNPWDFCGGKWILCISFMPHSFYVHDIETNKVRQAGQEAPGALWKSSRLKWVVQKQDKCISQVMSGSSTEARHWLRMFKPSFLGKTSTYTNKVMNHRVGSDIRSWNK